ncbi:hemolysin D [Oceanicola sp. 22II-s10i]|uniref:efflux RND transporter periplasmic adaptor subunit n=1 Tax=Oceanicola sp. 22II-s10i TaxID=1317116 RepID=UPI000B524BFC|nr:HlyD family efflux transporter periplasmic adaptor subunit [Oceanicola sp. 22II-s10i]OWU85438.1 hemolysin D [Oceanicola sp. 22II-s10i]
MRFLRNSLTGLFLLSVTLGLMVYAGATVFGAVSSRLSQEPRTPSARERVFAVNVVAADPGTITPVLSAFGQIQSRRTLDIRASAAGSVMELNEDFEDGGAVEAGEVLMRLDPVNAEAALARARADLSDAEAEGRDAARALVIAQDTLTAAEEQAALRDRAFRRQADLRDRGVGTEALVETAELAAAASRQSVLSARSALANAEARVDQAATALSRAELARDEAQRDLDDTTLTAEFAGTLSGVTVVEGRLVSASEMLGQLVDPDSLEVAFRVSTAQYARLLDVDGRLRQVPVTVTLDVQGIGLSAGGTVSRAGAAVGEGQVGRLIYARLDRAPGLKPGDFVTVTTEEPALTDVVRLPATAIDAAETVLVVGADERLEVLQVELLRRQGDDVIVTGDDLGGRNVVRERSPLLGAGIKVRILNTPDAEQTAAAAPQAPAMVELTPERRARIRAFVEGAQRMPQEMKARILAQLDEPMVPAQMVERIEARMGG